VPSRSSRSEQWIVPPSVWILAGLFSAYSLYALFRHWRFLTGGYDLGIFDQVVWHLSRFETPASTIAGHANIFADHFHPILVLLARIRLLSVLETQRDALKGGPLAVIAQLVTPVTKLRTVSMWLVPFALLPLRSPLVWLALPIVLARLLSSNSNHWGTAFHYTAPLAPILAMAAADGLARWTDRRSPSMRSTLLRIAPVVMFVLCAVLPGRLPLWRVFAPGHYRLTSDDRAGYEALATIPEGASVSAQQALIPHLSRREAIYGIERRIPDTDYVIATEHRTVWPNRDFEEVREILRERLAQGYTPVFERDGWIVLSRSASARDSK
jgi:uncharacterized membrane protein